MRQKHKSKNHTIRQTVATFAVWTAIISFIVFVISGIAGYYRNFIIFGPITFIASISVIILDRTDNESYCCTFPRRDTVE